ncbi:endonuclease NucS domain-containing protein [Deinococcus oregonensis]|uniref:Endonuclease NucS domain-containing protein n=1 Tax=Deinococcus oregonensis TaxID=1805970 RepID=A0ABV6AWP5_9DEIO
MTFLDAQVAQALELNEEAGVLLTGSEAQVQETLAAHPELIEPGLRVLNRELLVESGGIDLYVQDAQGRFPTRTAADWLPLLKMAGTVVRVCSARHSCVRCIRARRRG